MPYKIINKKSGYFVCKEDDEEDCLSIKPHPSKLKAKKQMYAVLISESKRKYKKKK